MNDKKQKISAIVLLSLIVALLAGSAIFIIPSLKTNPVEENLKSDQMIRILLVIADDDGNALATDALVYYPLSQRAVLFNVQGNTGAIFDTLGRVDRIDEVYRELGIASYRKEIEKLLGMELPFTLEIKQSELGVLTDLLGGLKIFIPVPVNAEGANGEKWLLPGGNVNLDGDKLSVYMNYNIPEEDDDEQSKRRQNVVLALINAIHSNRSILLDKNNFDFYARQFTSNIDENGLYRLLSEISEIDLGKEGPLSITGRNRLVDGKKLLFPERNGEDIKEVVKTRISSLLSKDGQLQSRGYILDIKNGTTVQGLARNTSIMLRGFGYDVLTTSNADSTDIEHTLIINHIGNVDAAKRLAGIISCYNIENEEVRPENEGLDATAEVDFTIILGKDFDGRYVRGGYGKDKEDNAGSEKNAETLQTSLKTED